MLLTRQNMIGSDILERHHHSPELVYGSLGGVANLNSPVKWTVTGGNDTWGTELHIGQLAASALRFDLNIMHVVSASTANKISIVEFYENTLGTSLTSVALANAGDTLTKAAHGLVAGDRVLVTYLSTGTDFNAVTVYHVINVVDATFQLALVNGGSAIVITGDATATIAKIASSSLITSSVISTASTTSDSFPIALNSPRVLSTKSITVRAKSESGSTIGIGFLLSVHTYNQ